MEYSVMHSLVGFFFSFVLNYISFLQWHAFKNIKKEKKVNMTHA